MKADAPLLRLYAFRIVPKTPADESGQMKITSKLRDALDTAYRAAKLDTAMPIRLLLDSSTRTSSTRDCVIAIGFGRAPAASDSAKQMATRLAQAMDQRSKPCLFVITLRGERQGNERQVVLWTFPQDEVFRLLGGSSDLDVLSDVFSKSSALRKAATFVGKNSKTGFLTGRVLDLQLKESHSAIADYWMGSFLEAQPQMSKTEGSRILGEVLRTAYDKVQPDEEAREQVMAAIITVRSGGRSRWSIDELIDSQLSGIAAEAVRKAAPNDATRSGMFDIDRDSFMERLRFRAFDLIGGVRVIAPVEAIGQQVQVSEDDTGRQIDVQGHVENERLRARL